MSILHGIQKGIRRSSERFRQGSLDVSDLDPAYPPVVKRTRDLGAALNAFAEEFGVFSQTLTALGASQARLGHLLSTKATVCWHNPAVVGTIENYSEKSSFISNAATQFGNTSRVMCSGMISNLLNDGRLSKLEERMEEREKRSLDVHALSRSLESSIEKSGADSKQTQKARAAYEEVKARFDDTNEEVKVELLSFNAHVEMMLEPVFDVFLQAQNKFADAITEAAAGLRAYAPPVVKSEEEERVAAGDQMRVVKVSVSGKETHVVSLTVASSTPVTALYGLLAEALGSTTVESPETHSFFLPLSASLRTPSDTNNLRALLTTDSLLDYSWNESECLVFQPNDVQVAVRYGSLRADFEVDSSITAGDLTSTACRFFGVRREGASLAFTSDAVPPPLDFDIVAQWPQPQREGVVLMCEPSPSAGGGGGGGEAAAAVGGGNVWDEPDGPQYIVFADKADGGLGGGSASELLKVRAATLNKLMDRLTNPSCHDLEFLKIFLLTYESFSSPDQVLAKIEELWAVPCRGQDFESFQAKEQKAVRLRIYNFMRKWLEQFFEFSPETQAAVRSFISSVVRVDSPKEARVLWNKTIPAATVGTAAINIRRGDMLTVDFRTLWQYEEATIAQQMTLIDMKIFRSIKPRELLNQAWGKEKYMHRARNVLSLIDRFNFIGEWAVMQILECEGLRERAQRFGAVVRVADELRSLHNYQSLMAIIGGLNSAPILRLKHTMAALPHKILELKADLEALMDASAAHKNYRLALAAANPPVVPYLGVWLKDLIYIDDGNPDDIDNLINFEKRTMEHSIISQIQLYQNTNYTFEPIIQLQDYLSDFERASEKTIYDISMRVEPRGAEKSELVP